MTELELEIARQLGASSFLVYSVLKTKGDLTALDLAIETGMSRDGIYKTIRSLEFGKVIEKKGKINRQYMYKVNDSLNWKIQ